MPRGEAALAGAACRRAVSAGRSFVAARTADGGVVSDVTCACAIDAVRGAASGDGADGIATAAFDSGETPSARGGEMAGWALTEMPGSDAVRAGELLGCTVMPTPGSEGL